MVTKKIETFFYEKVFFNTSQNNLEKQILKVKRSVIGDICRIILLMNCCNIAIVPYV